MGNDEELIEKRKEKILDFVKQKRVWVLGFLIVALILGIYIRSMPMQDHDESPASLLKFTFTPWKVFDGRAGLWDITRDDWTLGPDLDPWLFTRYAKTIVEQGSLPEIDTMRNVPLGFEPSKETRLLPYMIVWTYDIVNIFGDYSIEFAATIFPVIMFVLTILVFFLFVREVFAGKGKQSKTNANIISLIATFFMIVIPIFLSRTVAGIPEKESAGFFFMFLSFYLFLRAWKCEKTKNAGILGVLAGVSTALMGLISGLVVYIFITVAIASFIAFVLNKIHKKEFLIYSLWVVLSFGSMLLFSNRFLLKELITSLDTGLAFLVFFIFVVHFLLWNTKLKKIKFLQNSKLPKNIISLIAAVILGILLISIFFGHGFIFEKIRAVNQIMFNPTTGRWNTTVAENRQPFFTEWGASFGPFIKNIPVLFWLFFVGSVVLFKKMFDKIKKKDAWILTGLYILFFFGLVFSRYSPHPHIFDGENFISRLFYYGSALLLIGFLVYYYARYHKEEHNGFEKVDYNLLFLFSLLVLCLFTARSAVRLIMVLAPIAPIFVGYLIVASISRFRKTNDETWKVVFGILVILILILSGFCFWNFYKEVKGQAYSFVPSYYNQQWQKAMSWVRENTSEDAVFSHWWDYGYWVQSIGERATVLDGGNAISFWNYYMGRFVLTGDNQNDALEFLYNHNADYLLIDPTDIGKYGAFSSIGSDESYDRYSWIPTMISNENQIQETSEGIVRIYQGGSAIEEDIIYDNNGTEIFLPAGGAGIGGIILEISQDNESATFKQPIAVFVYNNQQYRIPLRYAYISEEFIDFGNGLEACAMILQKLNQGAQGIQVDSMGALMYISPRVMRGMLAQKYLLNDCFGNFPNFKLAHSEQNIIIEDLKGRGLSLNEFVYFQGVQGPIKIWEVKYTGNEQKREDYIDTDPTKYLSWQL